MTSWKDSDFISSRALKLNRKPWDRIADGSLPVPLDLFHIYIFGEDKITLEKLDNGGGEIWKIESVVCQSVLKLIDRIVYC